MDSMKIEHSLIGGGIEDGSSTVRGMGRLRTELLDYHAFQTRNSMDFGSPLAGNLMPNVNSYANLIQLVLNQKTSACGGMRQLLRYKLISWIRGLKLSR